MTGGGPDRPDAIDQALRDCAEHAAGEGIEFGRMLDRLGRSSFCFAALLLAVPFVQPFSLGPLTMVAGLALVAIGWQMGRGLARPVLPESAARLRIHGRGWLAALRFCARLLAFCRKATRPRFESWVSGAWGERFVGWLIFTGGGLLAMPAANLPFNNTLPALMVVFACVGWLERDGLMAIVSLAWGAVTLLYFAAVCVALVFFGTQVWTWVARWSPF
jgi:hypothetical protein